MSLLLIIAGSAALANAPDPLAHQLYGRWQTETRHGIVEIGACDTAAHGPLCGRLVDSDGMRANPALRDTNNKEPSLRSRPLRGITMLQGFHRKDGELVGGTIYNGEDGGTYQATLTMVDANTLKVKGCIVWPLCKSQTWKRVK